MTKSLESAIVRIYGTDRRAVGAGFLVRERHILTCAHVISSALGLASDDAPSDYDHDAVYLNFPLLAPGSYFGTHVCHWQPDTDIAGLKMSSDGPEGANAVRLVTHEDLWGHPFRAIGFPAGRSDGVWTSGVLRGRTAAGWVQIDDVKEPGYWVQPGFSGTPIWDEQLNGVVGMAVAAEADQTIKAAYMIPADALAEAWPGAVRVHQAAPRRAETTPESGGVTIGDVTGGIHGSTIAGQDVHIHGGPRRWQSPRGTGSLSGSVDLIKLREILTTRFSDSELRTLCFDMGIDYENLPGRGKSDKARELISYLARRNQIERLIEVGRRQRSDIPWETVYQGE
jgi:hypothetical protein